MYVVTCYMCILGVLKRFLYKNRGLRKTSLLFGELHHLITIVIIIPVIILVFCEFIKWKLNWTELKGKAKKVSALRLQPEHRHFYFFDETMSNCSQNCLITCNSAALCFKQLFHKGVWIFAQFVWPLLATKHCVSEIWSGSNNCIYMLTLYHLKKKTDFFKGVHHTDFEANNNNNNKDL